MKKITKFQLLILIIKSKIKMTVRYILAPIKAFFLQHKNIHVVDFISWDEASSYKEIPLYGSRNKEPDTLEEFNKDLFKDSQIYINALYDYIIKHDIKITGSQHQNNGVPLFSDNKTLMCSMRRWGRIMALIWNKKENKDYNYMDFYM